MPYKTAIFVPAYCLSGLSRICTLTSMARESANTAAWLYLRGEARFIILSSAYRTWQQEDRLKRGILYDAGIQPDQIRSVGEITNSYNEIEKTRAILEELDIEKTIIVAEKWHARRAHMIFRRKFPNKKIRVVKFKTPRYEITAEPSTIKSLRTGTVFTWALWNLCFGVLTKLLYWFEDRRKHA